MKFVPNAVTGKLARQLLKVKKGSPTILFAAGVVGVVGAGVMACRATLKLEEVLDEHKKNMGVAEIIESEKYTEEDRKKDIAYIHVRTAVKVGKLYAVPVLLGAASIAALTGSHNILSKRNAALTAAYAALEKGFNEYRERVLEQVGEDKEREFRYPLEKVEVVDPETGKKKNVKRVCGEGMSMYARFFDKNSTSWSLTPEYNVLFLRCQQNWANDRLRAKGHLFLNEVYDALGIERSSEGQVVGWVVDCGGDGYVDFGIFDSPASDRFFDFVVGNEGGIWLDFNVDGVVYDKI